MPTSRHTVPAVTTDPAEKLSKIFRLVFDLPDGTDVSTVRRINQSKWDSLANAMLVVALESEFSITLDAQEIERLTSYQSVLLMVKEKAA
jgi:acyl carrier protein